MLLNFCLRLFSAEMRLNVLGMCIMYMQAVHMLLSLTSSLWFSFEAIFFTQRKFCENGFFNALFPLPDTCHFELTPVWIWGNTFGAHFLQLYCKNKYIDPHFIFHDFNKNSASFQWEKNWHKSMFSFMAILLNCMDWAIMGRILCVQIKATLERKVKTRA